MGGGAEGNRLKLNFGAEAESPSSNNEGGLSGFVMPLVVSAGMGEEDVASASGDDDEEEDGDGDDDDNDDDCAIKLESSPSLDPDACFAMFSILSTTDASASTFLASPSSLGAVSFSCSSVSSWRAVRENSSSPNDAAAATGGCLIQALPHLILYGMAP